MPSNVEKCVLCQNSALASTMDMTGHGWRCSPCSQQAELNALENKGNMGEHLTPEELANVVADSQQMIGLGVLTALGGAVGTVLSYASYTSGFFIFIVFSGAFFGGIGLMLHGLSVKKQAKRALAQFPSARINVS